MRKTDPFHDVIVAMIDAFSRDLSLREIVT